MILEACMMANWSQLIHCLLNPFRSLCRSQTPWRDSWWRQRSWILVVFCQRTLFGSKKPHSLLHFISRKKWFAFLHLSFISKRCLKVGQPIRGTESSAGHFLRNSNSHEIGFAWSLILATGLKLRWNRLGTWAWIESRIGYQELDRQFDTL